MLENQLIEFLNCALGKPPKQHNKFINEARRLFAKVIRNEESGTIINNLIENPDNYVSTWVCAWVLDDGIVAHKDHAIEKLKLLYKTDSNIKYIFQNHGIEV